jgi:hypothetical protein
LKVVPGRFGQGPLAVAPPTTSPEESAALGRLCAGMATAADRKLIEQVRQRLAPERQAVRRPPPRLKQMRACGHGCRLMVGDCAQLLGREVKPAAKIGPILFALNGRPELSASGDVVPSEGGTQDERG